MKKVTEILLLYPIGVVLEADTPLGEITCTLGGSASMIQNSIVKKEGIELDAYGRPLYALPQCLVGSVNLRKILCYPLQFPKTLEKLDMILGMNAIKNQGRSANI